MKKRKLGKKTSIVINRSKDANAFRNTKPRYEDLDPVIDAFRDALTKMGLGILDLPNQKTIMDNLGEERKYFNLLFDVFIADYTKYGFKFRELENKVKSHRGRIKTLDDSIKVMELGQEITDFHDEFVLVMSATMLGFADTTGNAFASLDDEDLTVAEKLQLDKDSGGINEAQR